MSLEEALNRNTEMLERLCSIMGSVPFRAPAPKGELTNEAPKEEVPNEKPKSPPTSSTSQTSAPESAPVTYDDVKRATNAVSKISREKAIAGLARFGVQTATKLAEGQWSGYVEYMTKVAAGEIDPEASHE